MFQVSLVNQIIHAAIAVSSFLVFSLLSISPVIGVFSKIALKYPNDITADRARGVAQMARDILSPYAIVKRVVVNIRSIEGWVFTTDGFPPARYRVAPPSRKEQDNNYVHSGIGVVFFPRLRRPRRVRPSVRRMSCAVLWRDGYGETFRWSDFPDWFILKCHP